MFVAIISDTHLPRGTRRIPDRCIETMRSADAILHAGDFVSAQVLAELEALGPPVHSVVGNMDSAELRGRLPSDLAVELGGVTFAIVHDGGPRYGRLGRLRRRFADAQVVVFGHSHIPLHERDGDFHIFNPGSPTDRRRSPSHTMGLARIRDGAVELQIVPLE